ncbi:RAMP superfamily CRISPR-associated protein [Microcoleus sp. bin38.metabat.b11b12b14.051]|uniref:RAMP superfamily CRISPR-associated protein n=1 Tax=Microcoleus sp. bin38.metabat.b11b12b14.051 TaxID=2742709 RepID=UPI0025FA7F18|nr:RAMP superfamily CRISPR-associated protein [Microcoleus sp. bin38.metabat.b11b12b14.051]
MIVLTTLSRSIDSYTVTAVIDTALCVGAGGSSGSLADKPIVRNAEGNLLIPGSQIKGRLRHECEKIARGLGWKISESPSPGNMVIRRDKEPNIFGRSEYEVLGYNETYHCLISQIFGDPVLPSRVIFEDLICTEEPENLAEFIRPGVTINRRRGTAEEKKLYFLETSPPNVSLRFKGEIHLLPNCPSYAKPLMLAGFKHIHALGGSKSAGLGWLSWETLPNFEVTDADWDCLARGGKNAAN